MPTGPLNFSFHDMPKSKIYLPMVIGPAEPLRAIIGPGRTGLTKFVWLYQKS